MKKLKKLRKPRTFRFGDLFGRDLLAHFHPGCRKLLAYEADVYLSSAEDRITLLPDNLQIADYRELGVARLKFFLYYAPRSDGEVNERKRALVRDIGAQCIEHGIEFLMDRRHLWLRSSLQHAILRVRSKLEKICRDREERKSERIRCVPEVACPPAPVDPVVSLVELTHQFPDRVGIPADQDRILHLEGAPFGAGQRIPPVVLVRTAVLYLRIVARPVVARTPARPRPGAGAGGVRVRARRLGRGAATQRTLPGAR